MNKTTDSDLQTNKPDRRFKPIDILAAGLLLIIIVGLLVSLIGKLQLKDEVARAQVVSDHLISDISHQNGVDAHKLGSATFQKNHSETELGDTFASLDSYAKGSPAVSQKIVANRKQAKVVYIIYKYSGPPQYFIRATVAKTSASPDWQIVGISGNSSEAPLLVK